MWLSINEPAESSENNPKRLEREKEEKLLLNPFASILFYKYLVDQSAKNGGFQKYENLIFSTPYQDKGFFCVHSSQI